MEIRSVITDVDGIKIHHLEGGKGKIPFVLLHAFFSNSNTFRGLIGFLGEKYKVYVPDYPGFGLSEPLRKRWDFKGYNNFMVKWFRKMGLKDFELAGLSLGGTNMLYLSKEIDDLVSSYIFIQPYAGYKSLKLPKKLINTSRFISKIIDLTFPSSLGDAIWNSDKAISFILNKIDPFNERKRDFSTRMEILRTARFKTFVHTLKEILSLQLNPGVPVTQKPAIFVMGKGDDSLDYEKTYSVFSSYFPNITEIPINLVEHYPTEPLTTRYFKTNYPELLSSIKYLL
jgi:pimeloyl-ACP methyl ester carboxylesterase